MIARWLSALLQYEGIPDSTLRATYAALRISGLFARQRAAIAHELAVRAWAEAVAERLSEPTCVWTSRGGRS